MGERPREKRVDGWGHPFCVIGLGRRVAAISRDSEHREAARRDVLWHNYSSRERPGDSGFSGKSKLYLQVNSARFPDGEVKSWRRAREWPGVMKFEDHKID